MDPTGTAHPVQSINVAVNQTFCGKSMESSRHSLQVFLTTRPDLWSRPYREAIATQAGSLEEYCQFVVEPVVVSENSLMWLTRLALRLNPDLTPDGLGRFLGGVRVGMVLVVGFALLMSGASLLFTSASVLVACAILRAVALRDTIYPFVLVLPLLLASLFGIARASEVIRTRGPALRAFAVLAGMVAAFSASMRTMNLPLSAAMLAVFLTAVFLELPKTPARWTTVALTAVLFVLGFVAYNRVFVSSLQRADDPTRAQLHLPHVRASTGAGPRRPGKRSEPARRHPVERRGRVCARQACGAGRDLSRPDVRIRAVAVLPPPVDHLPR